MPKQVLVLYNPSPNSAVGPDQWLGAIVNRLCTEGNYRVKVMPTSKDMDHRSIAPEEINGNEMIVAAGGDGTVRLVLGTLAHQKSKIPAAIIPLGTGNQLARNLFLYEEGLLSDPLELAINTALYGQPTTIELGLMNGQYFAVAAGAGPISDAVIVPDPKEKATWKMFAYAGSVIQTFAQPPVVFDLSCDGETFKVIASGIFVTNISDLGVGKLSDTALLDDGFLDLCVLNPENFTDYLGLGFRFAGGFVGDKAPYYIRKIKTIDINVQPIPSKLSHVQRIRQKVKHLLNGAPEEPPVYQKITAMVDGDALGHTPMHIEVVPKAVRVMISQGNVSE